MEIEQIHEFSQINKAFYEILDTFEDLGEIVVIDEFIKKLSEYACVFIMRNDKQCIAFAAVYMNDTKTKKAYISLIGVSPTYQRKGFGGQLLSYCEKKAWDNGMKTIELEVKKSNQKAQSLYKKAGYNYLNRESNRSFFMSKELDY